MSQAKVEDVQGALKTAEKIGNPKRTVLAGFYPVSTDS